MTLMHTEKWGGLSSYEKTTTKTGLKVSASIIDRIYKTGKEATKGFKKSMKIIFDEFLGKWNYRAIPINS